MTGDAYQGHTPDTTDEQARAAFVARYGAEPREVRRTAGALLVGPIAKEQANDDRLDRVRTQ